MSAMSVFNTMLIAARFMQGFLDIDLILMAQVADRDSQL